MIDVFVCVQNFVNTTTDQNINQSKIKWISINFVDLLLIRKRIIVFQGRMQSINQSIKRYKHPAVYSIKLFLVSNFKNRVFKFRPEMLVLFWKKKQCFESPCTTRQTFQQHDWFKLISTIHMNLINFIAARSH